jgi:hypothetical protein
MSICHRQNEGRNQHINTAIKAFGNVANFRHLGKTIKNQNYIHEEINKRLNSLNVCYHSVQNLMKDKDGKLSI